MAFTRITFIRDLHHPRDTNRLVQAVNTVKPHMLVFYDDFLDMPIDRSKVNFTKLPNGSG